MKLTAASYASLRLNPLIMSFVHALLRYKSGAKLGVFNSLVICRCWIGWGVTVYIKTETLGYSLCDYSLGSMEGAVQVWRGRLSVLMSRWPYMRVNFALILLLLGIVGRLLVRMDSSFPTPRGMDCLMEQWKTRFKMCFNKTVIVLIPKVEGPERISQFRPISLCTVPMKLITKVLVVSYPNWWVLLNQAFFLGAIPRIRSLWFRKLFIPWELWREKVALRKIDLEKGIKWSFLRSVLEEIGFPISLIMFTASSNSFSILWNGEKLPAFKPSRGLETRRPSLPVSFCSMSWETLSFDKWCCMQWSMDSSFYH